MNARPDIELAERLRSIAAGSRFPRACREAADRIEELAGRVAELEARIATLTSKPDITAMLDRALADTFVAPLRARIAELEAANTEAVELFREWMGYGSVNQECRLATEAWLAARS